MAADIWNVGQEQINNVCERSFQQQQIIRKEALEPAHEMASMQSAQTELPAAARNSGLPLSRFPLRGKAGAGGFPPRRKHATRQQRALARIDAAGSPRKRAPPPCAIPRLPEPMACGDHAPKELRMAATSALTFTTFS